MIIASSLPFSMAPADCVLFSDGLILSTKKADRNFVRDLFHCLHLRMSLYFVGTFASSKLIRSSTCVQVMYKLNLDLACSNTFGFSSN